MFWLLYASVLIVSSYGFLPRDKKYGIPVLEPFYLPLVSWNTGALKLNFMQIVLTGLSKCIFNGMTFDPTTKHAKIILDTPYIKLRGKYEMNGKILVLAIEGKGDFEMNFYNASSIFSFNIEKETVKGKVYPKLTNEKFESKIRSAHVQFDNLFNGDKVLGPQINKVLNENWDALNEEVESSYKQTVTEVWKLILGNYFKKIPYENLFLD